MEDGVSALKDAFFSLFSWRDFVTGGGDDTYVSNLDVSGDIFTYDTVVKGVKKVVYFNQTEEPWGSMPYGGSRVWTNFNVNCHIYSYWANGKSADDLCIFDSEWRICVRSGDGTFFHRKCCK